MVATILYRPCLNFLFYLDLAKDICLRANKVLNIAKGRLSSASFFYPLVNPMFYYTKVTNKSSFVENYLE